VFVLGLKVNTLTRGTSYKFILLNQSIIRSAWEIWHNTSLVNPILIRLAGLERELRGISKDEMLGLGDYKSQRYNRLNM